MGLFSQYRTKKWLISVVGQDGAQECKRSLLAINSCPRQSSAVRAELWEGGTLTSDAQTLQDSNQQCIESRMLAGSTSAMHTTEVYHTGKPVVVVMIYMLTLVLYL